MAWTTDQVLALAPDASSAKAGRGLANIRKWTSLGTDERTAWGLCQGSGKDPYQTRIDLTEPAFKCSCPSRKFPCKHAIGLFLLLAEQPATLKAGQPPAWVTEWLDSRQERSEKKEAKKRKEAELENDPEARQKREEQQAKRAAKREEHISAGLEDLERWMRDLVRQGLAALQGRGYEFFDTPAKRLVDAQAPGLARLVRGVGEAASSGEGWQARTLERLGILHLAVQGYRRLETLPQPVQDDLRQAFGWTIPQDEVLAGQGFRDRWQVLGRRQYEEDHLRVQRVWLSGLDSGRSALILSFAAANQPLDASLAPGTLVDAELAFFPGAAGLRALVKQRHGEAQPLTELRGHADWASAFAAQAHALARCPWIEPFPMALCGVTPMQEGEGAILRDSKGRAVPIATRHGEDWLLLALSGGKPLDCFGEWDGRVLTVLTACVDDRYAKVHAASDALGLPAGAGA